MAPKGDPFNFDDIYSSMGASGLVKKQMGGGMKSSAPSASISAAPMPSSSMKPPALTASSTPTNSWSAPAAAAPKPAPAAATGMSDIDFDFFGAPAAAPTPATQHSSTQVVPSASPASADPFAAFEAVDGAQPAVHTPPASQHATPPSSLHATPSASAMNLTAMDAGPDVGPAGLSREASASKQTHDFPVSFETSFPPTSTAAAHDGLPPYHAAPPDGNADGAPATTVGSFTGMLKGFTKRAVKAAKEGLQQLELALEKMEHPASVQGGSTGHHQQESRLTDATAINSSLAGESLGGMDALSVSLRVMELPPRMWQEALETLPMPLRVEVADIIWGDHPPKRASDGPQQEHPQASQHEEQVAGYYFAKESRDDAPLPPPTSPAPPAYHQPPPQQQTSQAPPPPQPAAPPAETDLLGGSFDVHDFFGGAATTTSAATSAAPAPVADDMHDFFSGGATSSNATPPRTAPKPSAAASSGKKAADSLLNFGDDLMGPADSSAPEGHAKLYADSEERKRLRTARIAERNAKMRAALDTKTAMDEEEARKKAEQVSLKESYKAKILTWEKKHSCNIRGLLGSLDTVLWPDSGWKPLGMAELLEAIQVKKAYM
eukprot:gene15355-21442_t